MKERPLQNTQGRDPQALYSSEFDKPHYGVEWDDNEKSVYGYHYPQGIKGHHVKMFRLRTDRGQFDGMLGKALRLHGPTTAAAEYLHRRLSGHPRTQQLQYSSKGHTIVKESVKKTEQDIIAEAVELFAEAAESKKSSIGYSNEPGENEVWTHKAHGNRHLVMKGTKVGGMLGHIDRIPNVDMGDMSSDASKDGHHAYGIKYQKGKGGILKKVDARLGEFPSHEDALAAIKKFHKINEEHLTEDYEPGSFEEFHELFKKHVKIKKTYDQARKDGMGSKQISKLGGKLDDSTNALRTHPINNPEFWKANPHLVQKQRSYAMKYGSKE